jgi:ACS family tartrate transporter-like MFS transporter
VLLGFAVLYWLTDRPAEARWLNDAERAWLAQRMQGEEQARVAHHGAERLQALIEWRVWYLICLYFTVAVGANASGAYLPTLISDQIKGANALQVGLLTALPHLCAFVGMTLMSANSDRTGERRLHVGFAALLAACGWAVCAVSSSPVLALAGLCMAQTGMMSMLPMFWTLPTAFLSGAAAAGGIALINSVANIGGIVGAMILGEFGLWSMAAIMLAGAVMALFLRREHRSTPHAA